MQIDDEVDIDDFDKSEFKRIVSEEKKHRELINAIRGLATALKPIDNTNKISELVTSNNEVVDNFLNKLKEISQVKIPVPQVNISNENKELITISQDIKQLFTEIKSLLSEKKEWEFKVNKDYNGRLTGVTATQTNSKHKK